MTFYIYGYQHLISAMVYIGQTIDLKERARSHKKGKTYFDKVYRKEGKEVFYFWIVDIVEIRTEADDLEKYMIAKMRGIFGLDMVYNIQKGGIYGGNAGIKLTKETKDKISKANMGKKPSEETRLKLSKTHKGLNTWIKGRKLTEEHKQKISKSGKGKVAWNKGKSPTKKTRQKMSASRMGNTNSKGKKRSEVARQKMSKAQSGRIHSEETKIKQSIAKNGIHAKLTKKQQEEIISSTLSSRKLGKLYNISNHTILKIKRQAKKGISK
jgi:group I intron endonuclease